MSSDDLVAIKQRQQAAWAVWRLGRHRHRLQIAGAFRYRSAEDRFETFKTYYGPLVRARGALDDSGQQSLREPLVSLADGANRDTTVR